MVLFSLGARRDDTISDGTHEPPHVKTSVPVQFSSDSHTSVPSSNSTSTVPTPLETPSEDEEPLTTWPLESRHILVRTLNGQPPQNLPSRIQSVAEEGSFERVWNLSAVENVYDLGFWDNIMEILI